MSRQPVTIAFPPFFGFTRRVVIVCGAVYLLRWLLAGFTPGAADWIQNHTLLFPGEAHRLVWEFITWPFIAFGFVSFALALLSFWFFGSELERVRGSGWLKELFFTANIGGSILAVTLTHTLTRNIPGVGPEGRMGGLWPVIMALTLAYARLFPDRELRLYFFIPIKAKWLAALYLLIYLSATTSSAHRLDAMTTLCVAFVAYLYLRFAPKRGYRYAGSEIFFGVRNRMERARRRRAAKKFTVYMKKQGKDVNMDASGKYVSLDDETRDSRERKWMN